MRFIFQRNSGAAAHVVIAIIVIIAAAAVGVYFVFDKPAEDYDMLGIDKLGRVDPSLIVFNQVRTMNVEIPGAQGIAIDAEDNLYVCGEKEYAVYDSQGKGTARVYYDSPGRCIAVDSKGIVYVGHGDFVQVFKDNGPKEKWKPIEGTPDITSISAAEEDVFVADAGNRVVIRYAKDGTEKGRITGKPDPVDNKGFLIPSGHFDLYAENEDSLWVVNPGRHLLQKYTPEGIFRSEFGETGNAIEKFCGCCNPTDFSMLSDSRFITAEKGLVRVKLYAQDGTFRGVVAGPDSFAKGTAGLDVAADSEDRVYVLDSKGGKILIFKEK